MCGRDEEKTYISHVLHILHDTAREIHLQRLHNLQIPLHIITTRSRQVRRQAQLLQLCIRHDRHTRRGAALCWCDELVHFTNGDAVVDELQQVGALLGPGGRVDGLGLQEGRHGVGGGQFLLLVGNVEGDALGEDRGLGTGCGVGSGGGRPGRWSWSGLALSSLEGESTGQAAEGQECCEE